MTNPIDIKSKKPSLKNLFPNGEESYLAVSMKLYDQDMMHIVICNDRLAENKKIWAKTAEMIQDTELEVSLGTIKKEDFRVLKAANIINSQGFETISCVKTQAEYLRVLNDVIKEYRSVIEDAKTMANNLGLPPEMVDLFDAGKKDVDNTGIGTYTPQSDEEIEFMYQ